MQSKLYTKRRLPPIPQGEQVPRSHSPWANGHNTGADVIPITTRRDDGRGLPGHNSNAANDDHDAQLEAAITEHVNKRKTLDEAAAANIAAGPLWMSYLALERAIMDDNLERGHLQVLAQITRRLNWDTAKSWPGRFLIASKLGVVPETVSKRICALKKGYLISGRERVAEAGNRSLTNYTLDHDAIIKQRTEDESSCPRECSTFLPAGMSEANVPARWNVAGRTFLPASDSILSSSSSSNGGEDARPLQGEMKEEGAIPPRSAWLESNPSRQEKTTEEGDNLLPRAGQTARYIKRANDVADVSGTPRICPLNLARNLAKLVKPFAHLPFEDVDALLDEVLTACEGMPLEPQQNGAGSFVKYFATTFKGRAKGIAKRLAEQETAAHEAVAKRAAADQIAAVDIEHAKQISAKKLTAMDMATERNAAARESANGGIGQPRKSDVMAAFDRLKTKFEDRGIDASAEPISPEIAAAQYRLDRGTGTADDVILIARAKGADEMVCEKVLRPIFAITYALKDDPVNYAVEVVKRVKETGADEELLAWVGQDIGDGCRKRRPVPADVAKGTKDRKDFLARSTKALPTVEFYRAEWKKALEAAHDDRDRRNVERFGEPYAFQMWLERETTPTFTPGAFRGAKKEYDDATKVLDYPTLFTPKPAWREAEEQGAKAKAAMARKS